MVLPRTIRSFKHFAIADVYSGDIDPTYFAIARAKNKWGLEWASRFCVAMLTYYHTGTAAQVADFEGQDFWDALYGRFPSAPRASERRHFRGQAGVAALDSMRAWNSNASMWFGDFPWTYAGVKKICEDRLKQFGPYFQLKICDYMDRCLGGKIADWKGLSENLPTLPAAAVKMRYPVLPVPEGFRRCMEELRSLNLLAPPHFDRYIGPAEVETILCDWKRAKTGSSWIGADVLAKCKDFEGFGPKAGEMAQMLPGLIDRGLFKTDLID